MSSQAATSRAVLPVLRVGREPLLIDLATGRPMLLVDWEAQRVVLDPDFRERRDVDVFLEALQFTPAPVVIRDWRFVMEEADRMGLKFVYRNVNG